MPSCQALYDEEVTESRVSAVFTHMIPLIMQYTLVHFNTSYLYHISMVGWLKAFPHILTDVSGHFGRLNGV